MGQRFSRSDNNKSQSKLFKRFSLRFNKKPSDFAKPDETKSHTLPSRGVQGLLASRDQNADTNEDELLNSEQLLNVSESAKSTKPARPVVTDDTFKVNIDQDVECEILPKDEVQEKQVCDLNIKQNNTEFKFNQTTIEVNEIVQSKTDIVEIEQLPDMNEEVFCDLNMKQSNIDLEQDVIINEVAEMIEPENNIIEVEQLPGMNEEALWDLNMKQSNIDFEHDVIINEIGEMIKPENNITEVEQLPGMNEEALCDLNMKQSNVDLEHDVIINEVAEMIEPENNIIEVEQLPDTSVESEQSLGIKDEKLGYVLDTVNYFDQQQQQHHEPLDVLNEIDSKDFTVDKLETDQIIHSLCIETEQSVVVKDVDEERSELLEISTENILQQCIEQESDRLIQNQLITNSGSTNEIHSDRMIFEDNMPEEYKQISVEKLNLLESLSVHQQEIDKNTNEVETNQYLYESQLKEDDSAKIDSDKQEQEIGEEDEEEEEREEEQQHPDILNQELFPKQISLTELDLPHYEEPLYSGDDDDDEGIQKSVGQQQQHYGSKSSILTPEVYEEQLPVYEERLRGQQASISSLNKTDSQYEVDRLDLDEYKHPDQDVQAFYGEQEYQTNLSLNDELKLSSEVMENNHSKQPSEFNGSNSNIQTSDEESVHRISQFKQQQSFSRESINSQPNCSISRSEQKLNALINNEANDIVTSVLNDASQVYQSVELNANHIINHQQQQQQQKPQQPKPRHHINESMPENLNLNSNSMDFNKIDNQIGPKPSIRKLANSASIINVRDE